jgi:twitching motility protein PilI
MANRQALRELQSRLASRLLAARDEGASVAWLAAESGGEAFLFPLGQAGEIFPWTPVQPVAYTQPWFMGVANLRGALAGVVDLARFARHPEDIPARSDSTLAESSLLTFNAALGVQCALVIDRLAGLRGGDAFASVAPRAADAPPWFGPVYTDLQQRAWQEIDLQALAVFPSFLDITLGLAG